MLFYGCFLRINIVAMAIAIIIATAATAIQVIKSAVVARFPCGAAVGAAVGAGITFIAVSAADP